MRSDVVSMGVDLASMESRETGICILRGVHVRTMTVHGDFEILNLALMEKPHVIAIDAPLSLPKGKTLDSKSCVRECDKELLKIGIRFFPLNFKWMKQLTMRGIKLRTELTNMGFRVIETYPGGAQQILGIPRVKRRREELRRKLVEMFNLSGDILEKRLNPHELDAVTCAIVGKLYLEGEFIAIGDPSEMLMILPKPRGGSSFN
ncbi:MAG: DUF429 domain-containing protein [archaeon GBS-70-058]|nr:DUF429 domain-containing protein [Candidatus Culexarchaeum nevadense]